MDFLYGLSFPPTPFKIVFNNLKPDAVTAIIIDTAHIPHIITNAKISKHKHLCLHWHPHKSIQPWACYPPLVVHCRLFGLQTQKREQTQTNPNTIYCIWSAFAVRVYVFAYACDPMCFPGSSVSPYTLHVDCHLLFSMKLVWSFVFRVARLTLAYPLCPLVSHTRPTRAKTQMIRTLGPQNRRSCRTRTRTEHGRTHTNRDARKSFHPIGTKSGYNQLLCWASTRSPGAFSFAHKTQADTRRGVGDAPQRRIHSTLGRIRIRTVTHSLEHVGIMCTIWVGW